MSYPRVGRHSGALKQLPAQCSDILRTTQWRQAVAARFSCRKVAHSTAHFPQWSSYPVHHLGMFLIFQLLPASSPRGLRSSDYQTLDTHLESKGSGRQRDNVGKSCTDWIWKLVTQFLVNAKQKEEHSIQ